MGLITDPIQRIATVMDGHIVYCLKSDSTKFEKLTKKNSIEDFLIVNATYLTEPLVQIDLMTAIKYALNNVPLKWQREDTMNPEVFNDLTDWNIFKNNSVQFYLTENIPVKNGE